jgi:hypothetical protein
MFLASLGKTAPLFTAVVARRETQKLWTFLGGGDKARKRLKDLDDEALLLTIE